MVYGHGGPVGPHTPGTPLGAMDLLHFACLRALFRQFLATLRQPPWVRSVAVYTLPRRAYLASLGLFGSLFPEGLPAPPGGAGGPRGASRAPGPRAPGRPAGPPGPPGALASASPVGPQDCRGAPVPSDSPAVSDIVLPLARDPRSLARSG